MPLANGTLPPNLVDPRMLLSKSLSALNVDPNALPQLPQNYNYNDLANYEQQAYDSYAKNISDQLAQRRATLASSLNDQGKQLFDLANPGILEDLNSRGLFTSPTAVSQAQANALKQIALTNDQYLNQFYDAATATQLQAQQNALDSGLNIRESGLAANLQQNQQNQEDQLARDLAKQQSRNSLTNSLISGAGNIGSALLYAKALGGSNSASAGTAAKFFANSPYFGGAGGAGAGGIPGLQGGTPLVNGAIPSSIGTGGIGPFASGGALHAFGPLAGLGAALAIRNGMNKGTFGNTGNALINMAQPFFAPDKALHSLGNVVSNPGKAISNVFCFDAMTPITMADGSVKPICEMDIDDDTKGGRVLSVRISKTGEGTVYSYLGETVTGYHAVRENGAWIRVKDSPYAIPLSGSMLVYSLVTSGHRIHVNGIVFADEHETDDYETLTMDQSLAELNREDDLERVN